MYCRNTIVSGLIPNPLFSEGRRVFAQHNIHYYSIVFVLVTVVLVNYKKTDIIVKS